MSIRDRITEQVIDGHARKELDLDQIVPCLLTDLTEEEAA